MHEGKYNSDKIIKYVKEMHFNVKIFSIIISLQKKKMSKFRLKITIIFNTHDIECKIFFFFYIFHKIVCQY